MTTRNESSSKTQPFPHQEVAPLDALVRGVAVDALCAVGAQADAHDLTSVGTLADPTNQELVVEYLGRGVLTADMVAVHATELALADRSKADRVQVVAALGAYSSLAAQQVDTALAPIITRAIRQAHVAASLVEVTRTVVAGRHAERQFVHWVTNDPEGFARYASTAALRAAGARVWDRNWLRLTAQADDAVRQRTSFSNDPGHSRADQLEQATMIAREAAITSLVDSALADEAATRRRGWLNALEQAEQMPGTVAWSRYTQAIRAELGATTWTTTNNLISDHVAVVINELPWIAGFVAMITLAAEAATAAARADAVRTRAEVMADCADIDDALAVARSGPTSTLTRTA